MSEPTVVLGFLIILTLLWEDMQSKDIHLHLTPPLPERPWVFFTVLCFCRSKLKRLCSLYSSWEGFREQGKAVVTLESPPWLEELMPMSLLVTILFRQEHRCGGAEAELPFWAEQTVWLPMTESKFCLLKQKWVLLSNFSFFYFYLFVAQQWNGLHLKMNRVLIIYFNCQWNTMRNSSGKIDLLTSCLMSIASFKRPNWTIIYF